MIAPQDSPIPAAGSDAADLAAAAADATRPETPTQDCELLKLIMEDIPRFVHTPGPLLEPLKCYIVREKASGGLLTKAPHCYKLYLEDRDTFLLAARRRERTKCPSYVVSLDETELSRSSSSYCGKIKVCTLRCPKGAAGVAWVPCVPEVSCCNHAVAQQRCSSIGCSLTMYT